MSLVGPSKVKARLLFFIFTEDSIKVENKEHLFDFVVTLYFTSLCFDALHSSKVSQSTLFKIEIVYLYIQNLQWLL